MITARPFGGLQPASGHRLRAATRASVGTDVEVIWALTPDMVAPFRRVAGTGPGLRFARPDAFASCGALDRAATGARAIRAINRLLASRTRFFEPDVERLLWTGQFDLSRLTAGDGVFLFTCQSVTHWKTLDYSWVRPAAALREPHRPLHTEPFDGTRSACTTGDRSCDLDSREPPLEAFVTRSNVDARRRPPVSCGHRRSGNREALRGRFGRDVIMTSPKRFGPGLVAAIQDASWISSARATREIPRPRPVRFPRPRRSSADPLTIVRK